MYKVTKLIKEENGSAIIVAILIIFLFCAIGGIVIDASYLYRTKGEMQKAADNAAISGAQLLYTNTDPAVYKASAVSTATSIVNQNDQGDALTSGQTYVKPDGSKVNLTGAATSSDSKVTVILDKYVNTFFMKIFGIPSIRITVTSNAVRDELASMSNVRPIGVDVDNMPLSVGNPYEVKTGNRWADSGHFGFFDIGNGNSAGSENGGGTLDYMLHGSPDKISITVSQPLDLTEGNMKSISNSLPTKDNALIGPILIYKKIANGKGYTYQVVGFALCKIYSDGVNGSGKIYGEFIKTVDLNDPNKNSADYFRMFNTRLVN